LLSCYCPPPSEIGTVAEVVATALSVAIGGAGDVACISVVAFVAGVGALSMGPAVFSWRCICSGAFTVLAVATTAVISLVSVVASLVAISLVSVVASLVAIAASACVVVVVVVVAVAVAVAAAVSVVVVAVAVAVSVAVVVVVVVSVVVVAGDLGLEVGYG
jgi:hypothetical protein